MHVCITLRFAGTRYHGFQVQKNALSVCEVLAQNALESLYGVRPPVKGCSRTDSGVHALGYCVSYTQPKPIPPRKLPLAVNRFLPDDVRVTEAHRVPEDFHARYSAKSKEYIYRIHNSAVADPFHERVVLAFPRPCDAGRMERAAQYLVAENADFVSFMSSGSDIADTVRTVSFAHVRREGDDITFHVLRGRLPVQYGAHFCGHAGGSGRGAHAAGARAGYSGRKKTFAGGGYRSGAGAFPFTR